MAEVLIFTNLKNSLAL